MGIFSLLFRKNDILSKDESLNIETIETVSSKIEVVYPSGMLFKSVDSYVPNVDIMEIAVPKAMDLFKENYTVYFTEKLLSSTFSQLNFNISLRKEIFLLSTHEMINLKNFKFVADAEVNLLESSLIDKIINEELDIPAYCKIRQVILETFKTASKTDPYFKIMHDVFAAFFSKYNDIEKSVEEIKFILNNLTSYENLKYESKVLYIDNPILNKPSKDIMSIAEEKLKTDLPRVYSFDSASMILSKIIYTLHINIQNRLELYKDNISSIDYLLEIEKAMEELDLFLIEMIKSNKIDESLYLIIQKVLADSLLEAKTYDLYIEAIYTILNKHIENNKFFKEHISHKISDFFNEI